MAAGHRACPRDCQRDPVNLPAADARPRTQKTKACITRDASPGPGLPRSLHGPRPARSTWSPAASTAGAATELRPPYPAIHHQIAEAGSPPAHPGPAPLPGPRRPPRTTAPARASPRPALSTLMPAPGCSPWRPRAESATSPDAVTDGGGEADMRRAQSRPIARHLDLQNELPERVPNRALCAFVKSVAVCRGAPGR